MQKMDMPAKSVNDHNGVAFDMAEGDAHESGAGRASVFGEVLPFPLKSIRKK